MQSSSSEQDLQINLREILTKGFSEDELRILCFDLGLDYYGDLRQGTKASKVIELIAFLARRKKIYKLVEVGRRQRPDITWPYLPNTLCEIGPRLLVSLWNRMLKPGIKLLAFVTSTPERERNNLINYSSFPVSIGQDGGVVTPTIASGNLEIDFNNGQGYSGVALQFTPALAVREFTQLDISGTATQSFKFKVEYKVREGNQARVVISSGYVPFPAKQTLSIPVSMKYVGKVDEITLMFYVQGDASHVTIDSIRLK
jgi:hypothetical protein